MDKKDVVFMCNAVLLSHKERWHIAIDDNMDGSQMYYAKCNKSDGKRQKNKTKHDFTHFWGD